MLPTLSPNQSLTVSVLRVVIPIRKFTPTNTDLITDPAPVLHPSKRRFMDDQGVKRVSPVAQHMCNIHTSLPSNNLNTAGFTSTLISFPLAGTFAEDPSSAGGLGHLTFENQHVEESTASVWYKGIDVIRFWLTTETDEPQPDLFSEDWFMVIAVDVVDPDHQALGCKLMGNMLNTLQLMLVRQDQRDTMLERPGGNFF